MRKYKAVLLGLMATVMVAGCSTAMWQTYVRNDLSGLCDNPQNVLSNIPMAFITQAQAMVAVGSLCTGVFGTSTIPTPAPGSSGVFPTPAPSAIPTAVPAAKAS